VIAKVEPLTPARSLRGPFDYRLADELGDVGVGSMLVVPFGPRRLLGVVVEVAEDLGGGTGGGVSACAATGASRATPPARWSSCASRVRATCAWR
jgi:primosomal protein PriA-like protein